MAGMDVALLKILRKPITIIYFQPYWVALFLMGPIFYWWRQFPLQACQWHFRLVLVLRVVVNYIDAPQGNATFLFTGVALIAIAIVLNAKAYKKMSSGSSSPSTKGLVLSVAAGLLMGFFYRFVAKAMFADFAVPEPGKISPYTAMVFFQLVFYSAILFLIPTLCVSHF